jgi:2-succinyl-6-hydroxy-2,4-cyclohexadiene-1-carboxylate synthase
MEPGDNSYQPFVEIHPGQGPYVLLVHGFLSNRAQWMLNIEGLAKVARPVIVELWGHGRSPAPESPEAYRPKSYVRTFEGIRQRLGISKWLLCGQSLGAGLTLRYALEHPERIMAQVFTNTTSGLREIMDPTEDLEAAAWVAENILKEGRPGLEKIPVHPAKARHLPSDVKEALLADCSSLSVLGVANTIRYTIPEISVSRELHQNQVPALLVCGKQEKRFKPLRDFAEARMPLLEIADLDGGHAVQIEAAAEFNDRVTAFFNKHIT